MAVRINEVRRFALSLPEATEEPHFEKTSFRVGGKIFATMTPEAKQLNVFVDDSETHAVVADDPRVFQELWWGKSLRGVRVDLPRAEAERVSELLEEAWRRKAKTRLVRELDARKGD
jgi:hypothetical protein